MKEYEAFKGYYCGLCKAIKERYSHLARFMLNYDCAVLSLLLASMSDDVPEVSRETCIASPFKKKTVIHSKEAPYAAAVNILLGYAKIKDTALDDKRMSARLLLGLYSHTHKRAAKHEDKLAAEFDSRIDRLHQLEEQKSGDIDAVSAEFAHLVGAAFSLAPYDFIDDASKRALRYLG